MYEINSTHDPDLKSWVESANNPNTDFPLQNLPFCTFLRREDDGEIYPFSGSVIGNSVLDHGVGFDEVIFSHINPKIGHPFPSFESFCSRLDRFRYQEPIEPDHIENNNTFRQFFIALLRDDLPAEFWDDVRQFLFSVTEVEFAIPFQIRDYTDFYCSIYHATNVGSMFRPDNPLLPNYKYVPIGYHGRASSIVISGSEIRRPHGQNRSDQEKPPGFIPCKNLDYEMELGFFVGNGNDLGQSIPISEAEDHIFGMCLVNDWSARDIQAWEYQPLGPFLAKNFATTISPFVVTMEALAPFRTKAFERDPQDPQPLDYLNDEQNQKFGGLDINLEVYIQTEKMREQNIAPHLLSRSNTKDLYWTVGQMLTHHASNGCNLQTGDLIASGTVSGKEKSERGCLLELTWRGTEPIDLPSGEQRRFLEDGDEVIMKGFCEREGFRRIGFGECRGRILSAI